MNLLMPFILAALITIHVFSLGKVTDELKLVPKSDETTYVFPAPIMRITALEFDGLVSDYLFLKALVFMGSTFERTEQPLVKPAEWRWLYHILDASAGMDPYFLDPYYFASANLTWGGGLINETNALLEKGIRYRDWDHALPFYVGFNNFYFLQKNDVASEYLMEAARRSNGNPVYVSLATKLAYKTKRTENAILFLEEIIQKTDDDNLKKEFKTRRDALNAILVLENAVKVYKQKFGRIPSHMEDLVRKGIVKEIPNDPYQGHFYLDKMGTVKTTSEIMLIPHRR